MKKSPLYAYQMGVSVQDYNPNVDKNSPEFKLKKLFLKYDIYGIPKSLAARKRAIENINDSEILTFVALNDINYEVRRLAIKHIEDDNILFNIIVNCDDKDVCLEAIKHISDESLLVDITKNNADNDIGLAIIKRVTDDNILVEIYKSAANHRIRYLAFEYIKDFDILLDIGKNDSFTLLKAVRRIDDKHILEDMLQKCDDKFISSKISDRINFLEMKKSKKLENGLEGVFKNYNRKLEDESQKHIRQLEENERKRKEELFHARNRP